MATKKRGQHSYALKGIRVKMRDFPSRPELFTVKNVKGDLAGEDFKQGTNALFVRKSLRGTYHAMVGLALGESRKGRRMHELIHALQVRLHEEAGFPLKVKGYLAALEETYFFAALGTRKVFNKLNSLENRKEEDHFLLSMSNRIHELFDTRQEMMDAFGELFHSPEMRPLLERLNREEANYMDISPYDSNKLHIFFARKAREYRAKKSKSSSSK